MAKFAYKFTVDKINIISSIADSHSVAALMNWTNTLRVFKVVVFFERWAGFLSGFLLCCDLKILCNLQQEKFNHDIDIMLLVALALSLLWELIENKSGKIILTAIIIFHTVIFNNHSYIAGSLHPDAENALQNLIKSFPRLKGLDRTALLAILAS